MDYLIGRKLVECGFFGYGGQQLDSALAGDLSTPRIRRETIRRRAVAACALATDAMASTVIQWRSKVVQPV